MLKVGDVNVNPAEAGHCEVRMGGWKEDGERGDYERS